MNKAMQQDVSDYVIKKPNHIRRLPQTIFAAIEKKKLKAEREKIEQMLRQSERRQKEIIKLIPTALLVFNVELGIIESNLESQQLLGLSSNELQGRNASNPPWTLIGEDGSLLPMEEYPINQVILTKKRIMHRVVGKIGPEKDRIKWLLINAVPEFDSSERLINVNPRGRRIIEPYEISSALHYSTPDRS